MIDSTALTENDIGRFVLYCDGYGNPELGRIKSFRDDAIFVVFNCNNDWVNFKEYTAQNCQPKYLSFCSNKARDVLEEGGE